MTILVEAGLYPSGTAIETLGDSEVRAAVPTGSHLVMSLSTVGKWPTALGRYPDSSKRPCGTGQKHLS